MYIYSGLVSCSLVRQTKHVVVLVFLNNKDCDNDGILHYNQGICFVTGTSRYLYVFFILSYLYVNIEILHISN